MKKIGMFFLALLLVININCRDRDEEDKVVPKEAENKVAKKINVFIENSASMDGYINGNSLFRTDLREYIGDLESLFPGNVKIYFVNSKIHPVKYSDSFEFFTDLNASNFKVGDVWQSELNRTIRNVLNKTSDDTISIFISDCIYSVSGINDLTAQQTGTKQAFVSKYSKEKLHLSIVIASMKSEFKGTYYDMNNSKTKLKGDYRPYYIMILGNTNSVNSIEGGISKLDGFQNKAFFTSEDLSKNIFYTVVRSKKDDKGTYKNVRDLSKDNFIRGIKDIKVRNSKEKFTFTIAVDFSQIPLDDKYIRDKNNYSIDNNSYEIVGIRTFNKNDLYPDAVNMLRNTTVTHLITFKAKGTETDLNFKLLNNLPNWINNTSTDNDTDLSLNMNKTFGFKYLIKGIQEASLFINSKSNELLRLNIKVNN